MERSAAATTSSAFVSWEEVYVSSDKGRREVRYYLKRSDGTSDLAVVGKEKSLRHMSYHYAIRDRALLSISPSSTLLKLRSRREVIDWLNSIVPDTVPHRSPKAVCGSLESQDACKSSVKTLGDTQLRKLGHYTTEFVWLGSPWTCRKRRRHYQSFRRNGVKISVNDFVYVLAEEHKRLVAYLDDMYEDSKANKMVVVRWFHKIDEVGIVLPHNYNDREIFFSLCLQDLSIECIDGLATVLAPQHYERFLTEAKRTRLEPFVCHRQFDNDDIKPFDITQLKGYWRQEIFRHTCSSSPSKDSLKSLPSKDGLKVGSNHSDGVGVRPKKRLRRLKDSDLNLQSANKQDSFSAYLDMHELDDSLVGSKAGTEISNRKDDFAASCNSVKQADIQKPLQHLALGSEIEVLSQDCGLRGCWFRALVIKKNKDRVKVRYQDIKDAADEANNLEEWVLASKIVVPDQLGIRTCGRTTVRPSPPSNKEKVPLVVKVGTVVDVWWHDGWWEAIVLQKETEDKVRVYFPGEKQESTFGLSDLRLSEEWVGHGWQCVKERPDLVASTLSDLQTKKVMVNTTEGNPEKASICDKRLIGDVHKETFSVEDEGECRKLQTTSVADKLKEFGIGRDLSKDSLLSQLKWKSSKKRRRGISVRKLHYVGDKCSGSPEELGTQTFDNLFFPRSLQVDHDNCKYTGGSPFSSSVVTPLTSLVMSR